MKNFFRTILCVILLASIAASAAAETVIVAITDNTGKIVMANQNLEVADSDADGKVTICDALFAAHEFGYEGGAEAGFSVGDGGYGKCITKLWGQENGGSFGYYVNNSSAMNLDDPLNDGDYVKVYAYTDLEMWSDLYCNFDMIETGCAAGQSINLVLTAQTFDADWNPVSMPLENAMITIDGCDANVVTDADGKCTLTFDKPGEYIVSARSESMVLVSPVCIVRVTEA